MRLDVGCGMISRLFYAVSAFGVVRWVGRAGSAAVAVARHYDRLPSGMPSRFVARPRGILGVYGPMTSAQAEGFRETARRQAPIPSALRLRRLGISATRWAPT